MTRELALSIGSSLSSKLTPREQARLTSILARLASPYEGERAAAGLLASAFMEKHGLSWTDLTIAEAAPPPAKAASPAGPSPVAEKPGGDRRRGQARPWRGYCRRHALVPGRALSCLA